MEFCCTSIRTSITNAYDQSVVDRIWICLWTLRIQHLQLKKYNSLLRKFLNRGNPKSQSSNYQAQRQNHSTYRTRCSRMPKEDASNKLLGTNYHFRYGFVRCDSLGQCVSCMEREFRPYKVNNTNSVLRAWWKGEYSQELRRIFSGLHLHPDPLVEYVFCVQAEETKRVGEYQ